MALLGDVSSEKARLDRGSTRSTEWIGDMLAGSTGASFAAVPAPANFARAGPQSMDIAVIRSED